LSIKNKSAAYLLSLGAALLSAGLLRAQSTVIQVNNGDVAGLITAITTLNGGSGGFIELAQGGQYVVTAASEWWYGPNAFPAIQSNIYIEGNGATISRQSGAPSFRFFYVSGGFSTIPAGTLTLYNLTLQNGRAQGGRGGNGISSGGGAAGMGGAVFNQGTTTLVNVQLFAESTQGGAGGLFSNCNGSGGGGGLGGNGGDACGDSYSDGGGGGFQYSGGAGEQNGPGGGFAGNEGGSGSSGGTSVYGGNGGGGNQNETAGGGGGYSTGQNGGTPGAAIGGGSGGQQSGYYGPIGGGGGAFGGGGGAYSGPGGGGGVGGGGAGAFNYGGQGGFGGGGGGGGNNGAGGVFGGGSGAFYGYDGSGGGSGFGGAVFNHTGTLVLVRTTASSTTAAGGAGGQTFYLNTITGPAGQGYGGVIFDLNGSVTVQDSSISGANNNYATNANSVYVMSSNAGNTASGQIPDATLTQSNNSLNGTDLVVNQTNGTATSQTESLPEVSLQPAVLTCGGAVVGQSTTCSVTISNIGAATLTASFSVGLPSDFSVLNASACASIAAQSSCTLSIQFTAAAGGLATGAVAITSNAPDSPEIVLVSGTGEVPPASFTLSSTPNPAEFGALVTLSATISPSSATGRVTFYDGVTILGDAPVSDGVATLNTGLLSSGSRSLTALYEGGGSTPYAPIVSAADVQTVNALAADTLLATAPNSIGTTFAATFMVVNDFNGDGYQDLAMLYTAENAVVILLGNGSGGFTPASGGPYSTGGNPYSMVAADFNNDGIPDLAITSDADSNVTVLLGQGDGTFTPASGSPFGVPLYPFGMAVGDFNRDGNADLAIPSGTFNNVTVLLGNGSGGFTPASGSPITVGNGPFLVAVADFNGDGNADIAAIGQDQNVVVLLGNGQGGFTTAANPASVGDYPYAVATADFNGDGKADLAVANYFGNNVTVLLGNGSGGFTPSPGSPFPVPPTPYSLAVGDFNGDGHPDLAVATQNNTVTILLGNGSGGFTSPSYSPLTPTWGAYSVVAGQFNGDGHTDLAVGALDYFEIYDGAALPQLQITQQPSTGTVGTAIGNVVVQVDDVNGNLMTGSTAAITIASNPGGVGGTVTVNASGGIATFNNLVFSAAGSFVLTASSSGTVSATGSAIQIAAGSQTISFGAISSQTMGTPVALNATASSGLTVNFAPLTSTVCTVSGNTATLLKIGKCAIQATQPGNANYLAATPVNQSFEVTQGSQTITFGPLSSQPYGTAPFTLTASASSGLTVKYASTTTTVCTVSGATVTLVKAGTCTIRASQAGNANWAAATPVSQSFTVTKASQTITFPSLHNVPLSTGSITVSATASSGLTVAFASTTTKVCTVSGTKVTLVKAGTCTIKATQPGNADYAAAAAVDQSFQVTAK
jgi:hypothetical protein